MDNSKIPTHVSIIMDGNGRWAQQRQLERVQGHKEGINSVRAVIEAAARGGVKYLSLFAFSSENWNRPQSEISFLFKMMVSAMNQEIPNFVKQNISVKFVGDFSKLPSDVTEGMDMAVSMTSKCTGLVVIVALSYSGRWDIEQAAKRYAKAFCVANEKQRKTLSFEQFLSTAGLPDPDLLIRTSGEKRLSNFMLWQTAYTELYFTDVFWPDFRMNEFNEALKDYAGRHRRFGKTEEQINLEKK